jgi:hypothetical protein
VSHSALPLWWTLRRPFRPLGYHAVHIAQVIAGHRDINVTLGYKAAYPDEASQAHRAFLARRRALRPQGDCIVEEQVPELEIRGCSGHCGGWGKG